MWNWSKSVRSSRPQPQSYRRWKKKVKLQKLPTIPETAAMTQSSLSRSENDNKRIDFRNSFRHSFQSISFQQQRKQSLQRNMIIHRKNLQRSHPRQRRGLHQYELCLLILAPGYILFASLMFWCPSLMSLHRHSIHPLSTPRLHDGYYQVHSTKLRKGTKKQPYDASVMTKKRVVLLSSYNGSSYKPILSGNLENFVQQMHHNFVEKPLVIPAERDDSTIHLNNKNASNSTYCVPMAEWQSLSFPTCNSLHEINIFSSSPVLSYFSPRHHQQNKLHSSNFHRYYHREEKGEVILRDRIPLLNSYSSKLLGNGWFRHAWNVMDSNRHESVVVKTLR